jgi:hypothetical protein
MFTSIPTYSKFRTLKLTSPQMRGEDVYALQTALIYQGFPLPQFGADGYFGKESDAAVRAAQNQYGLVIDGLAGGATQKALATRIARDEANQTGVPYLRLYGQLEHESSFRLGIYSIQYANGSYDAGVAQRNTSLTPPRDGFTVPASIEALAARVRHYHGLFAGLSADRRWDLAQGSWNAPAWACWIARHEGASGVPLSQCRQPTDQQRATFEAYVSSVSAYAT